MKPNIFSSFLSVIFAIFFLNLLSACITENEPANTGVEIGDGLPKFSVLLDNGENVSTHSLKGKIVVIELFNTGCKDCQEGLPAINQLYTEYKDDQKVVIFAISRDENADSIEKYWSENGFILPYSAQSDRTIYNLFATTGIPRTYIADENGKITSTFGDSNIPTVSDLRHAIESIKSSY